MPHQTVLSLSLHNAELLLLQIHQTYIFEGLEITQSLLSVHVPVRIGIAIQTSHALKRQSAGMKGGQRGGRQGVKKVRGH